MTVLHWIVYRCAVALRQRWHDFVVAPLSKNRVFSHVCMYVRMYQAQWPSGLSHGLQ